MHHEPAPTRNTAALLGSLPRLQPALIGFLTVTIIAISPVGRFIDQTLHLRWVTRRDDPVLREFLLSGPDRLASQAVAGTILLAVAVCLAWRRRSTAPLIVAGLVELGFAATAVVKVALAKDATGLGWPMWWDGGVGEHGFHGMAYPSGHATESVLIYGTTIMLLGLYSRRVGRIELRRLRTVWKGLIANTVIVSWLLGTHWTTDLAGGLAFGIVLVQTVAALVDRGTVDAVARVLDGAVRALSRGPRALRAGRPPHARP